MITIVPVGRGCQTAVGSSLAIPSGGRQMLQYRGNVVLRARVSRGQNRTLRSPSAFWPLVFAGEQDAGQELGLDGRPDAFPRSDCFSEMGGIPVNDDGGEQVEPSHAAVPALAGAVADFALASGPERVLERVMSLALVQAGVGSALSVRGSSSGRPSPSLRPPPDRHQERLIRMVRKQLRMRDPIRTLPP